MTAVRPLVAHALALSITASIVAAAQGAVSSDRDLSRAARTCLGDSAGTARNFVDVEPFVVADPTHPARLAAVWQTLGKGGSLQQVSRSIDGGVTWSSPAVVPITGCTGGPLAGAGRASDSWAGFGADGRLYVSAIAFTPDTGRSPDLLSALIVVSSTDGGATWTTPVAAAVAPSRQVAFDNLAITADPTRAGTLYGATTRAHFVDDTTYFGQLGFTRSIDGGGSWSPMRAITAPVNHERIGAPQIVVDPRSGRLYAVYHRRRRGVAVLGVMHSDDAGQTWSSEIVAVPFVPAPGDPLHPRTRAPFVLALDIVQAAIDSGTGRLAIAYADTRLDPGHRADVSVTWSTDGDHWSAPVAVSDSGAASSWLPSIVAGGGGDFVVSWLTANFGADSGSTPPMRLMQRTVRTGPRALVKGRAEIVDEWPLSWPGDYHGLALSGANAVTVYGRDGDIAVRRRPFAMPATSPPPRPGFAASDSAFADSLVRAQRYPITLVDGHLSGEGARFLLEATRDAQFFVLGESHNSADIPRYTSALFDTLHKAHGFSHLAIEDSPSVIRMLQAPVVRGNLDSAYAFARRYPHALQFWNDQEVEMLTRVARDAGPRVKEPLWGLDQDFGATHVLDRLVALAPNTAARDRARALAAQARAIETPRLTDDYKRFISSTDSTALSSLMELFRPAPGSESARLFADLRFSNHVYLNHIAGNAGPMTQFDANLDREEYMKRNFMERYREAQRQGESAPKVMLKFGNVHGGRGLSPSLIYSLGDFVSAFATANGRESFHMVAWVINEHGKYWTLTEAPGYEPIARAGSTTQSYVIDLRPLRKYVYYGRLKTLSPDVRDVVLQYDAVLLIAGASAATRTKVVAGDSR